MGNQSGAIKKQYIVLGVIFGIALLGAFIYLFIQYDLFNWITRMINEETPAGVFIALMFVLPMLGVPFSIFVLLLAVKFGVVMGIIVLQTVLPLQMLSAYLLVVFIRRPIENYLVHRKNFQLPKIPENKEFIFSFFFLALPVLPYAPKLYLLPMAGVKFRYCFWLNWVIQGAICVPYMLAGKSAFDVLGALKNGAEINYGLLGVTIFFLLAVAVLLRWLKQKYANLERGKIT